MKGKKINYNDISAYIQTCVIKGFSSPEEILNQALLDLKEVNKQILSNKELIGKKITLDNVVKSFQIKNKIKDNNYSKLSYNIGLDIINSIENESMLELSKNKMSSFIKNDIIKMEDNKIIASTEYLNYKKYIYDILFFNK